ncbi:MAG: hypothetical protein ACXWUG_08890 [Polyangiales bacterium]
MRLLRSPVSIWFVLLGVGCGGNAFDVSGDSTDAGDDTAATSDGASGDTSTAGDTDLGGDTSTAGDAPSDTGSAPVDAGCTTPAATDLDVYVDASVAASGKGSAGCPVKTILEGLAIPAASTITRTIHVKTGSYAETDVLHLAANMRLVAEGGVAKVSGGSKAACTPHVEKCLVQMEGAALIDGFDLDASSVGNGIFAGGTPKIRRTTISNAQKDGAWLQNGGELGPGFHADQNGYAGVMSRAGNLTVLADASVGPNSFDKNKGKGFFTGSTYTPASGLVLMSGTLDFQGGSASSNAAGGVAFAWAGAGSATTQKITNLVAQNNAGGGVDFPAKWGGLVLRNSVLTKNGTFGLWYGQNGATTLDIGGTGASGGNTFGGASDKNGKVGVFLCHSAGTGSQLANGDKFAACAPSQVQVANCDALPASYADVGYVPAAVATPPTTDPVSAGSCTVGP